MSIFNELILLTNINLNKRTIFWCCILYKELIKQKDNKEAQSKPF